MKLRDASLDKDAMCHPLTGGCGLKLLKAVEAAGALTVTPSRGGVD